MAEYDYYTQRPTAQRPPATVNGPSSARLVEGGGSSPTQSGPSAASPAGAAAERSAGMPALPGRRIGQAAATPGTGLPGVKGDTPGYQPVREVTGKAPGPRPTPRR
jgi:hypothetical protein